MVDKILISNENIKSIIEPMFMDIITKIKNKDISLPYTTQLSKSSYLKIDGSGDMFLSNGGKYIHVGNMNSDILDINKIYNIFSIVEHSASWNGSAHPMLQPVHSFGCVEYNGKIYCIAGGGYYNDQFYGTLQIYDIESDTWSYGTGMPIANSAFGCVEYGGKIYCIGGYTRNTNVISSIYIYDILSNSWSSSSQSFGRVSFGCVEINGMIYLIGGSVDWGRVPWCSIFDIVSNTMTSITDIPEAFSDFGCVKQDGMIYCIGSISNKTYIYDIAQNQWISGVSPPITMNGVKSILYNSKIYCMTNPVYIYDIKNDSWDKDIDFTKWRSSIGLAYYDNRVYAVGGYFTDQVDIMQLPYNSYNIPIPDSLYSKLNKVVNNGDGTKIFHNDGRYKSITPTYQAMDSQEVDSYISYLISLGGN